MFYLDAETDTVATEDSCTSEDNKSTSTRSEVVDNIYESKSNIFFSFICWIKYILILYYYLL